jgi:amino acid transporter/mannitol/fructose-specific phosphotransferase system IIA component (Ntr-type)
MHNARNKQKRLSKDLKLKDVYAISTGATLSAGFFLLPGIAAVKAGPALILAYMLAAIPMVPAMFSVIELATAMPRAGGVYYFLDRALGPFFGTIGGIGTWLALILKVSFALIGMGAYIALFLPQLPIVPVALLIALILGGVNIIGTKKSGRLQIVLVVGLLSLLALFIFGGIPSVQLGHFQNFFAEGFDAIISTSGMVYISYVGITKVASLSEEIENPERNIPRGMILSLSTAVLIYLVGTSMLVALVPPDELAGNLTPIATAAGYAMGPVGIVLLSVAAILAFVSVANAGIMSASRYPLAMSRDHLLPQQFRKLGKFGTPVPGILLTLAVIIAILILFDPMRIAKLASSFQLLMFSLVCLSVIVMRESRIDSYDPGYRSPLYPWMQILGIILPLYLIFKMGWLPTLFTAGLILFASLWFFYYARHRTRRNGAIYHVFARLGQSKYHDLDSELRGILREKGLRQEDPFDDIVARSLVLDLNRETDFEELTQTVAAELENKIGMGAVAISAQIMGGTRIGATPVTRGVALPHFRCNTIDHAEMVLVRARQGVRMTLYNPLTHEEESQVKIRALFFLVSPEQDPAQHLRILARIAERVEEESFSRDWILACNEHLLRQSLLQDDHFLSLVLNSSDATGELIGIPINAAQIPKGCLVAMLHRDGHSFVPNGSTVLRPYDQITVIGSQDGFANLKQRFSISTGG